MAVLGVGDSITASCGFPTGNLHLATWAQWVARALGEPVTLCARSGATTGEIRRELLPTVEGRYRLALVYVGTNDILKAVPVEQFAADLSVILERLVEVADTVLIVMPPLWVGRVPTIAPYGNRLRRIFAYGRAIRAVAQPLGVHVIQGPEMSGPRYVAADRVHPTAAGQLMMADTVAWALRDLGWDLPLPSTLVAAPDTVTATERTAWAKGTAVWAVKAPARKLGKTLLRR